MIILLLSLTAVLILALALFVAVYSEIHLKNSHEWQEEKNSYICSGCIVGKQSYELDPNSTVCPYISSCKNNSCEFYVPIKEKVCKIE